MTTIYLAEVTAAINSAGATTVLRYSSGVGYAHPSAPGFYEPRITQPANLTRSMWGTGTTSGSVSVGFGEFSLANIDGALDALADYGFDGRSFVLMIGDDRAAYSSFETVLTGTMETALFSLEEVTLRLRDKLALFDLRPASPNRYGGTNVLPAGLDGTPDDLGGRPKPKVYGTVYNVSPPSVNTSRLVYQVNDGAVQGIPAVYDSGAALTVGATYSSQADMETNSPAASGYRVWLAGGMFRLGSSPAGQVTADVVQGAAGSDRTAAQILEALATGPGALPGGDVSSTDITALDVAQNAEIGLWIDDDRSTLSAMETVANAVGVWFGFDRSGQLRMGRLASPSGTPAVTLRSFTLTEPATTSTADIVDVEKLTSEDAGRGIPPYQVTIRYNRNWTQQANGLAGSVADSRRAFLAQAYRTSVATDTATLSKHPLSPTMQRDTLLLGQAAADAEAARLLALYGVRRDRLRVRVRLDGTLVAVVDLGAVVDLILPRFGYATGRHFVVTGMLYDAANDLAELELWG